MGLGGAQVVVAGREFGHAVRGAHNAQTRHSKAGDTDEHDVGGWTREA